MLLLEYKRHWHDGLLLQSTSNNILYLYSNVVEKSTSSASVVDRWINDPVGCATLVLSATI
jgi:hypothetical protein